MTKSDSTTRHTVSLFWQHMWRYPRYVIGMAVFTPLTILFENFLPPIVLASVLSRLAKGDYNRETLLADFGTSLLVYAVLLMMSGIGWRIVDGFNWRLEAKVERDMAQRIYDHLLDQSANFHANTFGGSLVSQTNKLLGAYIRFTDTSVYQVLTLLSSLVFTAIILTPRAPQFVVVLLILSVVFMLAGVRLSRRVRALSAKQASDESLQTGYLADSVSNIMAIKSFAARSFERKAFAKRTTVTHDDTLTVMRASQRQMAYFSAISRVISFSALLMAVLGVVVFNANIAIAFLIFSYTNSLIGQLWMFCNNAMRNYNRVFGDAADMTEILRLEPEIKDPVKPQPVTISKGAIRFDDVKFTHDGSTDALFHGLTLDIKAGEKVGLVGHSGSGKTTLTRLLLRFSDVDGGVISIDGQNIADVTQDDLRRHIAYVPQEPIMFHRTLQENIGYGQQDAPEKQVLKAARASHADEFIQQLPQKYETLVGERGVKLSGGQRQRIAIARAMLKNAPVLLLDEATSALDSESEVLIQDALWKLMEGRTAIVIAHRLSTIQKMDRIIVLEDGKIIEQGKHKELLKHKGTYAKLWAHQSGGFLTD